jgi:hypothetical protein
LKSFPPPHFYHIAEPSNMTSIRRHGLLSTEQLVRRAVRNNAPRDAILGTHRADALILRDGVYIRDQRPMPPSLLKSILCNDMTPSDWYRFLNGFVFLWANEDRLNRHLRAFEGRRQVVLTFHAKRLLADLGHQVFLAQSTAATPAAMPWRAVGRFSPPTTIGSATAGPSSDQSSGHVRALRLKSSLKAICL